MDQQELISKLTLLLLYLTSWEEQGPGTLVNRSWKGYDFDVLDKLENEGFISKSNIAKSVYLTAEGTEAAKQLDQRLRI